MVQKGTVVNRNYKVVWVRHNYSENIMEMYDRPKQLCAWWMRMHKHDSQYQSGKLCLVSMMNDHTS